MTEQLKTLMDRAADQDFSAVDLDAITSAGDRTVRRRRLATGVAGVAALAAIVTGAAVLGGDGGSEADFVDDPFRTDVPMWTEGSTLHTPDATYDLGVDVLSFVRTSEGIVFTGTGSASEERLGVYSFTGEGEPEKIGETADPHLRSDPQGPFAGWLDQSGDRPETVVLDQGTGEQVWSAPARLESSFPIVVIDGARAYLSDSDEHPTQIVDLDTGKVTNLGEGGFGFVDVEGELAAHLLEGQGGEDIGLEVRNPGVGTVQILNDDGGFGVFSPGGRWISAAAEDISVYDTATGEPVGLGPVDDREGFGYAWADADTLMLLADAQDGDALVLMACEVPGGACEELMTIDDLNRLFAVSDSDLLWSLLPEVSASTGPVVEMEATSETVTAPAE
jgi:hypothetical protein